VDRKSSLSNPKSYLLYNFGHSDGKEVKLAAQQAVVDVDQVKRLSSNLISADYRASPISSGVIDAFPALHIASISWITMELIK